MIEKIQFEIDYIEFEINELQRRLDKEVENFKKWVADADAGRIATIPGNSTFQFIQSDVSTMNKLRDQKRWLVHLTAKLETT